MIITKPYDCTDNEVNKEQIQIAKHWASRNGEVITELKIYEYAVHVFTESGRHLRINLSDGQNGRTIRVRQHTYMHEILATGKQIRIKKENW